jgi:predicted ATP-binding protein involved in virulence
MVEKLIIDNFAGIEHLEIEVKKINIMIGPQASGKSVCAKLLFYFKEFVSELIKAVENDRTKRQLDSSYSNKFKEYFPPKFWGNYNFVLRYEINHDFIQISRNYPKSTLLIDYSDSYNSAFSVLRKIHRQRQKEILDNLSSYDSSIFRFETRIEMMNYFEKILGKESTFSHYFIPAIRSFFAHIQKNVFSVLSNQKSLDPFIENFGSLYELMKEILKISEFDFEIEKGKHSKIKFLAEKILCGKYIHEKGEDFLEFFDGRKISISNCSSGQQETLPLVILLCTIPLLQTTGRSYSIYIEEPEAHIFPSAQKHIVELIATVFNSNSDGLQFFITTHSPYILTATNNLLQAGLIYQDANDKVIKKLEKIVPRYKALLTEDVAVYSLMDGLCQSIISEETGLIDTNIIDSVSEELAMEFDQLLDLI